jgi:cysteine synthase B
MIGAACGYAGNCFAYPRMRVLSARDPPSLWRRDYRDRSDAIDDGAQRIARELHDSQPEKYFYPNQYNNDANWLAHYETTAKEVWEQTEGKITHFLTGLGTSGTFVGTVRRLRELNLISGQLQCSLSHRFMDSKA